MVFCQLFDFAQYPFKGSYLSADVAVVAKYPSVIDWVLLSACRACFRFVLMALLNLNQLFQFLFNVGWKPHIRTLCC